ncbi:prostaglandin reductase 3 [Nephila pilipes]|uniref:15-oxoprostaglandin 13-reductase n=1 Tax=Nephila pilipes TaxID=299642 RepID=A0A8X6NFR1_NEPPI|nr:prostaglandin reductase 3 [Nephila pilipes]
MVSLPRTYKQLMVRKLTTNFREAVYIENVKMGVPAKDEVCVINRFVGVNASDVNMSKGRYFVSAKIPFGTGIEGVGEVVQVGENVTNLKVGANVAYMDTRCSAYAEYVYLPAADVFPISEALPEYVVLLVSGLTAAIALEKCARITAGDTVLITAAAGGTGHVAVQWAKSTGCHVIGTCSSDEKKKILKDLRCDRIINLKKEDLGEVLAKEYPNGVNVIWETIGGKIFEICMKNLAIKGRLLVVGGISGYKKECKEGFTKIDVSNLPEELLLKSNTVQGFSLLHYWKCAAYYFRYLSQRLETEKLKVEYDNGEKTIGTEFFGVEGIIKGVEHLHSGKNIGKVIVRMS